MKKVGFIFSVAVLTVLVVLSAFAISFDDVDANDYYAEAAMRMADRGILSGYGDGMYYGDQPVTRAQIAALVCKMLGKTDEATALAGKTVFRDVSEDAWYTGYINYAVANDIIAGDGDGNFRPDDNVKYEEVIKVIVCVLDLDGGIKIDPSDWSREYINAAKKAGLTGNLIGKKGTPMLRSDIAVICDAAMTILDGEGTAETTTTRRSVGGAASSPSTSATTDETLSPDPEQTRENQLPVLGFGD